MATTSVIICSIDEAKFARVCANYRTLYAGRELEIIGIHDARSLAEGYNRGVAKAAGDTFILSHDDIEILSPDLALRIDRALGEFDLIGVAGTTRVVGGKWSSAGDPFIYALISSPDPAQGGYGTAFVGGSPLVVPGVQALDGVFIAMRRQVAAAVAFDAEAFDGFHLYDLDFTFRAYLAGCKLAVCRDIVLIHDSTGSYGAAWTEYKRRFERKHVDHLPAAWQAKEGARAVFATRSKEEIVRRCAPDALARVALQITQANATL